MDEYAPIWFLALIGLLFFIRLVVIAWINASWNKPFRLLADHFGGTHRKGNASRSKPVIVWFEHRGVDVAVTSENWLGLKSRRNSIQFKVDWIDPKLSCKIQPKPFVRRVSEFFIPRRFDTHELERSYLVRSDQDTDWLITPGLRWSFAQLDSLVHMSDVHVTWQKGKMTVKIPSLSQDYDQLVRFTNFCLEFYEEACAAVGADITFLQERRMEIREVMCKVCGEPIEHDIVWCSSCRTPHHQECWQYAGACSTYACGQKRYVAARHNDHVMSSDRS